MPNPSDAIEAFCINIIIMLTFWGDSAWLDGWVVILRSGEKMRKRVVWRRNEDMV